MARRFHKSVKIAKGVKVNFSKSGASLSLGGHGHSVNFSSRGTRSTVGIPGTGLSYSSNIAGGHSKSRSSSRSSSYTSRSTVQIPKQVEIHMNEMGQLLLLDGYGSEITDKAVIRKIKSQPKFQAQIAELEEQRLEKLDEMVQKAEEENERFINICALAPFVDSAAFFELRYDELKPEEYEIQEYDIPAPTEESIKNELANEAEEVVKGFFLTVGKARRQYVEEQFHTRFEERLATWEMERDAFYAEQQEAKRLFDIEAADECTRQKAFLRDLINGEDSAVCEVFDSWIETCELPVEIFVDYDWNKADGTMLLDVDMPEIEDIPATKLIKTDSGKLKEKKKTQTELRGEYARLVFGLAVFITANAFDVSPAIKRILISGYSQRENKEGVVNDDYLYSIKFPREMFEEVDFSAVSPREFCLTAENKCNMTSTSLFKAIVPFDSFD